MAVLSIVNIKNEFLNFLRNSNIVSITIRGVTTITDTFTAAGGAETFTLTQTGVKNVRWVKDNGVALVFGTDYTLSLDDAQVVVSKVLVLGHTITINFDYGTGDSIYPDYPRPDLTISSYPRLGFDIYGLTTEIAGMGNVNVTSFNFDINLYDTSPKEAETKIDLLRSAVITAQTSLYYLNTAGGYLKPKSIRTTQPIDIRGQNKVFMSGFECEVRNLYEIN